MGGFSQQAVNDNGGVAWAKQVAQNMDPGAIDSQIQSYKSAASSLASVQSTLQNVKNNLASSWTGDAADQAQQSFQGSINHAQVVQDTISQSIIPPLQSAKTAQQEYITSMTKVPAEQKVPSNSFLDDVGSIFGVETPAQKAQSHNLTVRNQTAEALNTLSDSYESSAKQLSTVGGNTEGGFTSGSSSTGYNLGSVPSSSGDGAASAYGERVSAGGAAPRSAYVSTPGGTTNPGPGPKTTLSGTSGATITDPNWAPAGTSPASSPPPFTPDPIWSSTGPIDPENSGNYNTGGLITDEPENVGGNNAGGENGIGDEELNEGKLGTGSGVFDETGLGDDELTGGTGSGLRAGMSNTDGSTLGGESEGAGAGGIAEGEGSESGMGGSMGRGMGGMGEGEENLGSSKYTRGRYIGQMEEDETSSLTPVRSAFEDATDADGNKVNMMGSGRRGATPGDDEEDERGKRPSYLKEDEFWNNAQRIVPPVIQ